MKQSRIVLLVLLVLALLVALVSCTDDAGSGTTDTGNTGGTTDTGGGTHAHTYADAWTSDANYHWHAATCGHEDKVKDKAAHTYENGSCAVCGFKDVRVAVQVVIDNAITETIYTDAANEYKITIPEKPEDITVNPTVEKYFYGWFTDPNYQTPLQEDTVFTKNAKIYGKWIAVSPSDFTCSFGYGKATITKYTGSQNVVVIPAYINDFPVTWIGEGAFSGQTSIRAVIIADGVTTIDGSAFENCNSMTSVSLPKSLTKIGEGAFRGCALLNNVEFVGGGGVETISDAAFEGCRSLASFTIPDSVTSIGSSAFSGCTGLTSITVADGNTVYHSAGNCLIETETKTLVAGCKNSVIPTDGSVTSIGYSAFCGCTSLTSITIPSSVTSIGSSAFSGCTGLTSITIPSSVTSIGSWAFRGCTGLTSITYSGTKEQWNRIKKSGNWAYGTDSFVVHCTNGDIEKSDA